ncbi:hypothetical protein PTKIN_Ptkin04bG0122300 [Pterospermum kingtungense]
MGERNSEFRSEQHKSLHLVADRIMALIDEYNRVIKKINDSTLVIITRWLKPPPRVMKVDFDGAFDRAYSHGGIGIIIKDSEGFMLAFKALKIVKPHICSMLML